MIGTIVNTACIVAGSVIGSVARRAIKEKYQMALYNAMGLAAFVLGINAVVNNLPKSDYPVLFIVSLALGSLLGEGLSTGILLFCVGTLSMVGPVMSALYGDNTYLFANATLDLVTSAVLASTYGIGMVLAAPVLFCSQGLIYLVTSLAGDVIPDALMREISIVGGVLIASSGLGILKIKDCRTLNMLPALLMPVLFFLIKHFLK